MSSPLSSTPGRRSALTCCGANRTRTDDTLPANVVNPVVELAQKWSETDNLTLCIIPCSPMITDTSGP